MPTLDRCVSCHDRFIAHADSIKITTVFLMTKSLLGDFAIPPLSFSHFFT